MKTLMSMLGKAMSVATEDVDTTEKMERELTIYAKIGNLEGLEKAGEREDQIQLEAPLGKQFCRVRKTTKTGMEKYVFTLKVKNPDVKAFDSAKEYNVDVDKDFLEGFAQVASSKQEKTRYVFDSEKVTLSLEGDENVKSIEMPTLHYEVDVFKTPHGEISEWCKIDVELDSVLDFMNQNYPTVKDVKINVKVSHLPFKPEGMIQGKTENAEEQAFIKKLWEEQFKTVLNGA